MRHTPFPHILYRQIQFRHICNGRFCFHNYSFAFKNSSSVTRFNFGKAILCSTLKCVSSETKYSAPAAKAQSTNLLSSGSAVISSIRKCGSMSRTFLLFRINSTTFSAIEGVICWLNILDTRPISHWTHTIDIYPQEKHPISDGTGSFVQVSATGSWCQ